MSSNADKMGETFVKVKFHISIEFFTEFFSLLSLQDAKNLNLVEHDSCPFMNVSIFKLKRSMISILCGFV